MLDLGAALNKSKNGSEFAASTVDHSEEKIAAMEREREEGREPTTNDHLPVAVLNQISDVKADFFEIIKEAEKIRIKAKDLAIVNDATAEEGATLGIEAARLIKNIEARQKQIIETPSRWIQGVKNVVAAIVNPLQEAKTTMSSKINQYRAKTELDRREQEKKICEASEKLQEELDADAKAKGIEAPVVAPAAMPDTKKQIKPASGGMVYQTSRWVCRVEDPQKVPREYCIPSTPLLNEAVKNGVREIAGCKIEQVTETRMRG